MWLNLAPVEFRDIFIRELLGTLRDKYSDPAAAAVGYELLLETSLNYAQTRSHSFWEQLLLDMSRRSWKKGTLTSRRVARERARLSMLNMYFADLERSGTDSKTPP